MSGLNDDFQQLGGGAKGSIGGTATWVLAVVGCLAVIALLDYNRRQRRRFGFPLRPMWAEALSAVAGCAGRPRGRSGRERQLLAARPRRARTRRTTRIPPGGLQIPSGFPWPVLLLVGVTIAMTFIATRRKFGRYVYAYGGNPEAAELAGINTRWTIMKMYMLMGLCA